MKSLAATASFVGLCLCGCATQPPIQAAWYFIPEHSRAAKPGNTCVANREFSKSPPPLAATTPASEDKRSDADSGVYVYLALLNQSLEIVPIREVALNVDKTHQKFGWRMQLNCEFKPGQIVILPTSDFHNDLDNE